jgi:hypothetical protein
VLIIKYVSLVTLYIHYSPALHLGLSHDADPAVELQAGSAARNINTLGTHVKWKVPQSKDHHDGAMMEQPGGEDETADVLDALLLDSRHININDQVTNHLSEETT